MMINEQLINPKSIVVVGGSNNMHSPGGKTLKNLIDGNFKGEIIVVNPRQDEVQGIKSFRDIKDIPFVELAIIAISAKLCPHIIEVLAKEKNTKAFILISAGFSEDGEEGAAIEKQIVDTINSVGGCLIGPNCIGYLNSNYNGVFTSPIPKLNPQGCDLVSASGALAVFIVEACQRTGLNFANVFSVGNSAQVGVEEVIKYWDENYDPRTSSNVKLLYMESIDKPEMLLKHASSLVRKGCRIAAIKSGFSEVGSRAASSHTGAMANSDVAVDALFQKAGIVRCYGRRQLATVGAIFLHTKDIGENVAIITHAGGPAVMLTDALSECGLKIPIIEGPKAEELLSKLHKGSTVANPIDFLATGTAEQLGDIIDYCEHEFSSIDAMVVIFGSPGLFDVFEVYDVLDEKMKSCRKPIFPVLPSTFNAAAEIEDFLSKGRINFTNEVSLGKALLRINQTSAPAEPEKNPPVLDKIKIRNIIDQAKDGYLMPTEVESILDAAGIPRVPEAIAKTRIEAVVEAEKLGLPVAMKVVGPLHKSDVEGVVINVKFLETVLKEFDRMIKIPDTQAILLQPMQKGTELFIGAKYEERFGHIIVCGLGGIFIEVFKDISARLAPVSSSEAKEMICSLKSYSIIKGARNQEPVNETIFADIIMRIGELVLIAPEIIEMDLNPLLGTANGLVAVDARIHIEKNTHRMKK